MIDFIKDPFVLAILFILFSSLFISMLNKLKKDRSLKKFENDYVYLMNIDDEFSFSGKLLIESTGIEFFTRLENQNKEESYILYKDEFDLIKMLIRIPDLQSEKRIKELNNLKMKLQNPKFGFKIRKKINTFFKLLSDAIAEFLNLLVNYAKKSKTTAAILNSQAGYVNKMKSEIINTVGKAYDPIIEKYLGRKVCFEILEKDKIRKFKGILMSYTVNFIEFWDVSIAIKDNDLEYNVADVIIPQKICIIRNSIKE